MGMRRFIDDPEQMLRLVYAPDMVARMDNELKQAEEVAVSGKVKQRLGLIRKEFDYLRNINAVIHLYHAYRIKPDRASLDRLLDAIDAWNALLDSYYDSEGLVKPLPGWPELKLFRGHSRSSVGLVTLRHWNRKEENPFAWDTGAMRNALQ
jgi:hypothetical protein